jgi:hypothetical protein
LDFDYFSFRILLASFINIKVKNIESNVILHLVDNDGLNTFREEFEPQLDQINGAFSRGNPRALPR